VQAAKNLGKRKKLPVFVVTATPAVSKSIERFGKKKKASRSCGGGDRRGSDRRGSGCPE
jgi:ribosomal protein L1